MAILKKDNYSLAEVEELLQAEGDKARKAAESRFGKDYIAKTEYDTIKGQYDSLTREIKTKEFNVSFEKIATELKLKKDYYEDVKALAGIKMESTPEVIKETLANFKVSKGIFFENQEIKMPNPGHDGSKTTKPGTVDDSEAFYPGTLTRKPTYLKK